MRLNKGDTIGIIALSGDCDAGLIDSAKTNIEDLGFKVELSENIYDKNRYLAGFDDKKIQELHRFYQDSKIKLILAARGGYGTIRIINKIDYDLIKKNPKPVCGFSDVTALLLMIYKKTGIINFHSPMALTDFGKDEVSNYTKENFFNSINSDSLDLIGKKVIKAGNANGILWGGNLATVVSLCGQDFIPQKDFIFFAEDINEPVYKIDRMFQQLININIFKKGCKGVILGDFIGVDNEEWLDKYFEEMALKLDVPTVRGFRITHDSDKITLPIGAAAELTDLSLKIKLEPSFP